MKSKNTNECACDRRCFLKVGGMGLAFIAASPVTFPMPARGAVPERSKPVDPVLLQSRELEVILDRQDGLPYEYRPVQGAFLRGEDLGNKVAVTIAQRTPWDFRTIPVSVKSVDSNGKRADCLFEVTDEGKTAASFAIRYALTNSTLHISLENIREEPGFELIDVAMPRLVTVREEDGGAWLAHGDQGGSRAVLSAAKPGKLPVNPFWGDVLATLPVVMLGTDRAACVLEVSALMDGTYLEVTGENGYRRAALGTVKRHRLNGSLCHDMNLATPPGPRNCGDERTPNLTIGQPSTCRLDFLAKAPGEKAPDWLDGAKLVRQRMPDRPTRYYDDKLVYSIHCDEPHFPKPHATFEQAEKLIHDIAALTDNSPQVVHLWGWQYRGKDTGYPAVAEVNQRIGGYQAMMRLMKRAREVNCTVTLSDNYDDAYASSPAWNPDIVARRPDGELWKSRDWTGEQSYVIGLAKYMEGPGAARVRYTCERYKLRDTILLDVLTYFSIRNDWDRKQPASGVKNLVAGRYKVLSEFAEHGVDVSSEALRYAFIGKVTWYDYADGLSKAVCPFGGEAVPILPVIYRKSAIWGEADEDSTYPHRVLKMLLYNAACRPWVGADVERAELTDLYYLVMVPWFKMNHRHIESFRQDGADVFMNLEGNAEVQLNLSDSSYSVRVEEREIARNGATYSPLGSDRIALYSLEAKELAVLVPREWDTNQMSAIGLHVDRPEEYRVRTNAGIARVFIPARHPVHLYKYGDQARARLLSKASGFGHLRNPGLRFPQPS